MNQKAFTLLETIMAMFVSMLVIFGIVSTYLNGIVFMKRNVRHLRAQQEAIAALNQIGDHIRGALDVQIYNYNPPNAAESTQGNAIETIDFEAGTSVFYYINNKMYCIPNFNGLITATNSEIMIARDIRSDTYFLNDSGSICFNLVICDSDDTNHVMFSSLTRFTPRN